MKKRILFTFSLFFLTYILKAQDSLPSVYEIKSDTAYVQKVDSTFWQKLEDKEGKWTFEQVSNEPLAGKFHIKGTKATGIDTNDVRTYWHRYRFKNTMAYEAKISLTSPVDFFDVYIIKEDSSISHYRSGVLQKWEEKDGLKIAEWGGAISLVLKPEETIIIYDRRYRKYDKNFRTAVRFLSTDKLEQKYIEIVHTRASIYSKLHLQEAFMLGLLFLSGIFSIFLFRVTRERVYIYFALFTFFLAINRHWNIADAFTRWYMPGLNRYVPLIGYAWIFIPFFLLMFIRNFFDTRLRYPAWNKLLEIVGWLQLAIGIAQFIIQTTSLSFSNIAYRVQAAVVFLVIPLLILVTSLLYIRSKFQSYRFLAIGAIPYVLLYIITAFIGSETIFWDTSSLAISQWLGSNFRLLEMITLAWLLVCFTWVLFMRFDTLQKENIQQALDKERLAKEKEVERNELIAKQKNELEKEVAERTADLKESLEDLKATQSQLIQSEKMASLGELTAGIAHEIQNPLNFVNNFSDVNAELIDEMQTELQAGNNSQAIAISNDIKSNQEKITHHGKRAGDIVKSMLQHSRSSSATKETTDINKLADEYLRLAYHGLRAKDKSFNATMKTDFDESIGNINVIPQDMGRVILNLITNAFYATNEKQKQQPPSPKGVKEDSSFVYEPVVTVTTKRLGSPLGDGGSVEIRVADNGNGIPQKILDKIFQPFFTTKPTGEGTGLGLSMSYDIVTKGHGGQLKVATREGEGTEFIIILPI